MAPTTRSTARLQREAAQLEAENEAELQKTSNTHNLRKRKPTEVPEKARNPMRSAKKVKVSHQNIEKRKRGAVEVEEVKAKAKKPKISHQMTEKRKRGEEDEDKAQEKEEPVRLVKRRRQAAKAKVAKEMEVKEVPKVRPARSGGSAAAPRIILNKGKARAASSERARSDDNHTTDDNDIPTIFSSAVREELLQQHDGRPTLSEKAQGKKPAEKEYLEESFADFGNGVTIHYTGHEKRKILTPEEMEKRTDVEKAKDIAQDYMAELARSMHKRAYERAERDKKRAESSSNAPASTHASTSK